MVYDNSTSASKAIAVEIANLIKVKQSQKDGVVFQGADSREFWQRAEGR